MCYLDDRLGGGVRGNLVGQGVGNQAVVHDWPGFDLDPSVALFDFLDRQAGG